MRGAQEATEASEALVETAQDGGGWGGGGWGGGGWGGGGWGVGGAALDVLTDFLEDQDKGGGVAWNGRMGGMGLVGRDGRGWMEWMEWVEWDGWDGVGGMGWDETPVDG